MFWVRFFSLQTGVPEVETVCVYLILSYHFACKFPGHFKEHVQICHVAMLYCFICKFIYPGLTEKNHAESLRLDRTSGDLLVYIK